MDLTPTQPGPIVIFGSGETSAGAQAAYEYVFRALPQPLRVAIMETPAGFELNSAQVAGRIAEYLALHLQNHRPEIDVVPARARGTAHSPDDPMTIAPLLASNVIFLGPGSPSYAVAQLRGSLAWQYLRARHLLGAAVILASAAALAAGAWTIPVYEIYKVGQPPHWIHGLDLLAPFGLSLVLVPHWNNNDGGEELDTRHAFMGERRFAGLRRQLDPRQTIVGIDESTALIIDLAERCCRVVGPGQVRIIHAAHKAIHDRLAVFPLSELGIPRRPAWTELVAPAVWQQALAAEETRHASAETPLAVPGEVIARVQAREAARQARDWPLADDLRSEVTALGWRIEDTPAGPRVTPADPST